MNHAEYLCHSSGPWKKHKYFQKIGKGANAVYRYKAISESYKEDEQKALNNNNDESNAELDDKEKQGEAADRRKYDFEEGVSNISGTSVENRKKKFKHVTEAETVPNKAKKKFEHVTEDEFTPNKAKKKLKHDGMYSSECLNHADEVARGQAKIDALFGR